ncbi:MAG: hypothetical protein Q4C71_00560 [Microbacteriaceae bacterium]|nr:hypothetical protein [Microbacteriaceae bacterium]
MYEGIDPLMVKLLEAYDATDADREIILDAERHDGDFAMLESIICGFIREKKPMARELFDEIRKDIIDPEFAKLMYTHIIISE